MKPSQLISRDRIDSAYDELHAEAAYLRSDLEFAYKRSKVLADILGIRVQESPGVTGTILGLVRRSIERLIVERDSCALMGWNPDPPDEQGYWWWWNLDGPPIPVSILFSGTENRYFAAQGQHGWNRFQWVDDMGGMWMRLFEPKTGSE